MNLAERLGGDVAEILIVVINSERNVSKVRSMQVLF
ncbi:MAG: hypothetical protein QOE82_1171 [Thermoanaerobaculia bacterium]|jgi:hypothetical protein|nr:hypothetical protein [Thermoanaerobaculia bacterium]